MEQRLNNKVAIGKTSSATQTLDVSGNITIPNLAAYMTGGNSIIKQNSGNLDIGFISSGNFMRPTLTNTLSFFTTNVEHLIIDSSGNVGIDKIPSYSLDVSGTGRFTGGIVGYFDEASLGPDFEWNAGYLALVDNDLTITSSDNTINIYSDASYLYLDTSIIGFDTKGSASEGIPNQMSYDASYLYICTSTNIWGRVLLDYSY